MVRYGPTKMRLGDRCLAHAALDRYIGDLSPAGGIFFAGFASPIAQANGAESGGSA
jgi:hypothetical protein